MEHKTTFHWKLLRGLAAAKAEWRTFMTVTLGTLIMCVGIMAFTVPNRFPDVGVTGLAVLSNYVWGISPSWLIAILNGALFVWGWKELSPRFVLWSVYAVVLTTISLQLMHGMPYPVLHERLLIAILAGAVKGVGIGMIFKMGSSTGGTDIIVMVLRKRLGIEVGMFSFYINSAVLALSVFVVGLENALYGLVSMYTLGVVMDSMLKSFDRRKQVYVITDKIEEVREFVTHRLNKGVTLLHGEGGFTGQERKVLMALMTPRQAMDLKRFLAAEDPGAFMVVSDASEVIGHGFKRWKGI